VDLRLAYLVGEEGGEFLGGVEVAHGGVGEADLLHLGELPNRGVAHAAASEPVEFAADDAEGVVVGADGFEAAGFGGVGCFFEEDDVDRVGLRGHLGGRERSGGGDGGHFVGVAEKGVDGIAEGFGEVAFDLGFEFGGVAGGGFEKDVAAGDEGGDVAEFERFEMGAKDVHFEATVAEVDTAKEGDVAHGEGERFSKFEIRISIGGSGLTGETGREVVGDVDAAGTEFSRL
jgi:hypothetical protein